MTSSYERGVASLLENIVGDIEENGPLTFARFMERALYDEEYGYYMTLPTPIATTSTSEVSRIGWSGDFYTAPDVHRLLAHCLFAQIRECDVLLGRPSTLTVMELGPGKGLLARDILQQCAALDQDLSARMSYVLVERSPAMRQHQERALQSARDGGQRVEWTTGLNKYADQDVTGVVISNEFVDALPVHRVAQTSEGLHEIFVGHNRGTLGEQLRPPSTKKLEAYLADFAGELPEGYRTEVHLASAEWIRELARILSRGVVITIDYGHTARDYYDPARADGTLLCYYRHKVTADPYQRIGEQDMTAHVNFSALATYGEQAGLRTTGYTNMMNFLLGLGAERLLADVDPESEEMRAAIEFLRPQSMGQTFKVLVQHRGLEEPALSGLTFQPFFQGALFAGASGRC